MTRKTRVTWKQVEANCHSGFMCHTAIGRARKYCVKIITVLWQSTHVTQCTYSKTGKVRTMQETYKITDAAKPEIARLFGELAAISLYIEIDRTARGNRQFAALAHDGQNFRPAGPVYHFFDDQIEKA